MEEKEIKIRVSKETFEALLEIAQNKLSFIGITNQRDIYFDTDQMIINNLNRGLRVRFDNENPKAIEFKSLFYNLYSRKDNPWYIEEITLPIPLEIDKFQILIDIFHRLGLQTPKLNQQIYRYTQIDEEFASIGLTPKITVTKHRQTFRNESVEFVYDFIEELGYFVEIETKDGSEPMELLEQAIGDKPFQFIRNGYNDMVAFDIPNCLSNDIKQQLFKINPKWNVLGSEIDLVNGLLQKNH